MPIQNRLRFVTLTADKGAGRPDSAICPHSAAESMPNMVTVGCVRTGSRNSKQSSTLEGKLGPVSTMLSSTISVVCRYLLQDISGSEGETARENDRRFPEDTAVRSARASDCQRPSVESALFGSRRVYLPVVTRRRAMTVSLSRKVIGIRRTGFE